MNTNPQRDCVRVVIRHTVLGRVTRTLFAVQLIIASIGCGGASGRGSVTGTALRTDGGPLVAARVIARPNDTGITVYGQTDRNGYFELLTAEGNAGIPAGDYSVTISEDRGDLDNRLRPTIAAKYGDPSKSGVSFSVKPGESVALNLKLEAR